MTREHAHRPNATETKEPVRLIALSDGLFATVLTLLVLDLRVPETLSGAGGSALGIAKAIGPHFFSYLLTFLVSGNYWMAHHRDFDHIVGYDRNLLSYNMLFLLFIGLLPFSTAAISLIIGANDVYPFYWAVYAANISAAGIMLTITWSYAVSHQLVRDEVSPAQSRQFAVRHLVTPAVFLLSAGAEFLAPRLFLGPWTLFLIPVGQFVTDRRLGQAEAGRQGGRAELLWRAGAVVPWLLVLGLAVWAITL